MNLGISPLLVKTTTLSRARETLARARTARIQGNMRLAMSRAVTAVIQAARASHYPRNLVEANRLIEDARAFIQSVAIHELMSRRKK